MKHLAFTIVACTGLLAATAQTYSKAVEAKIKEVENDVGYIKFKIEGQPGQTIEERMAFYNVKGLSIAIVRDYKIEWAKGYGWADEGEHRRVTTETMFEPGSISKSINAMGILKLVQDKKIDLDADINTYLTSWKFPYDTTAHNKKITMANLLSHSAGLGVHGFPGYFRGDTFPTIPQILDGKKPANTEPVRSVFAPGLRFQYSGGGTMISELIAMDVTKQAYDELMAKTVLEPLGMRSSFYTQPPPLGKAQLLATGYKADGHEIKTKYPILIEQAAGGLWTTPSDLARFMIDIQLSLKGKSNKVLNKAMTEKMLTPYVDEHLGLGVFVEDHKGHKYFQHSAGNQGFGGQYIASFEGGYGVAIVANSDNAQAIIREVFNSVIKAYNWAGYDVAEPVVKKEVTLPDSVLEQYVGIYKQNTNIVTITKEGKTLWYRAEQYPWKAHFTSALDFFNTESLSEKTFYKDENGRIAGFRKFVDGKDVGKVEKVTVYQLPDSLLDKYAGTYVDDANNPIVVLRKGHELWADAGFEQPLMKIIFLSPDEFYIAEEIGSMYHITFTNNKVDGAIMQSGNNQQRFVRKP